MIKTKKLKVARETLVLLSAQVLHGVQAGDGTRRSAAPGKCEPSGIIACPTAAPACA